MVEKSPVLLALVTVMVCSVLLLLILHHSVMVGSTYFATAGEDTSINVMECILII